MQPKLRASVLFPGGTKFGEGRADLLRLVDSEGSLRRAVKRMGMSYRAAWGYLQELEAAAGFAFLERAGAGPSAGMRLTSQGRAFVAAFDAFRARLAGAAAREFSAAFGGETRPPKARRRRPAGRSRARAPTQRARRPKA